MPQRHAGFCVIPAKEIDRTRTEGYHLVVIVTAPHADHAALQAARAADLVAIPCRPSTFDIAAISATLDLSKLANKQSVIILNAAPIRSRVTTEAVDAITERRVARSRRRSFINGSPSNIA